ncbi:pyridoxal phosphate-dependent transferase [Salix suchowensis]|nr:pyridoxal phosphate-dependent transferase [Salix suchowensis]
MATATAEKKDRSKLIPFSSRLKEGRALAQDRSESASRLHQFGPGIYELSPPAWVTEAAEEALRTVAPNHYSHPKGRIRLREAIKKFYGPQLGRELDVESEILVTSGANEGQYSVFTAFLEQGDEVIMFEPFFDQYLPSVTFNGGKPVYVPLHPPAHDISKPTSDDWTIDIAELRKSLHKEGTRGIAAVAEEFNLLVMSDEVVRICLFTQHSIGHSSKDLQYDCLVFDGKEHVRIANLPGMWDRTVTVCSAGKAFAATGWRVGWLIGPASIIQPTLAATTRIVFCTNSPLQEAAASGLEQAKERQYFEIQRAEYAERRKILADVFDQLGLKYTLPEGSYFILLDISNVKFPDDYPFPESVLGRGRDFRACWFIAMEIGVSSIPVSEVCFNLLPHEPLRTHSQFYCEEHANIGEAYARFAFCKDVDTLGKAAERLKNLKNYM